MRRVFLRFYLEAKGNHVAGIGRSLVGDRNENVSSRAAHAGPEMSRTPATAQWSGFILWGILVQRRVEKPVRPFHGPG
jgi:hypothetical protein